MQKLLRVLGVIVAALVLAIVSLIFIFDPPPLWLRGPDKVALSVPPAPKLDGLQHPIDQGIACHQRLAAYTSSAFGRPEITIFDWLRRNQGKLAERDVHLTAEKTTETWAVKVDRATNTLCYQKPSYVQAGMTDPYCGPKIIRENDKYLVALEDHNLTAAYFDKKTYTLTMTGLSDFEGAAASIEYFDCY